MALVFNPLSEDTLLEQARSLYPKHAFVMRQLGEPPELDTMMTRIVGNVFAARGYGLVDADASTGAKDFLARILGLIRGTAFTVAIFSEETRSTAMANIALELGFAAMCGKPLVIVKSEAAKAPSDLARNDWVVYAPGEEDRFRLKLGQALNEVETSAHWTSDMLTWAMEAERTDCAVAFERASKAFLLTGEPAHLDTIEEIGRRLAADARGDTVADLERVREEVTMFARLGRRALPQPAPARRRRARAAAA